MQPTFVFLVLLVGGVAASSPALNLGLKENSDNNPVPDNILDDLLLILFNRFQQVIVNGSECNGLPPLDPLIVPNAPINITQPLLKAIGAISNASAVGLQSFRATSLSSNLIQLSMALQMEIGEIVAEGDYDINGMAMLVFPIYGQGPFRVNISGIEIGGVGALALSTDGHLSLKSLDFNFTLGAMDVRLEGLLGGGELGDYINEVINAIGRDIVGYVEQLLHEVIRTGLIQFVNHQLADVTLIDLIGGLLPDPSCFRTTTAAAEP